MSRLASPSHSTTTAGPFPVKKPKRMSDADCVYDIRLFRRLKRRRIVDDPLELQAKPRDLPPHHTPPKKNPDNLEGFVKGTFEQDYAEFLKSIGVYKYQEQESEKEKEKIGRGEEETDPHYEKFLRGFRHTGSSYTLEVKNSDSNISRVLNYFEDNKIGSFSRQSSKEELLKASSRRIERSKNVEVERVLVKEKKNVKSANLNERREGATKPVVTEKLRDKWTNIRDEIRVSSQSGLLEEAYHYFLKNLKVDGGTLVFVTGRGEGVRYEEDDGSEVLARGDGGCKPSKESKETPLGSSKTIKASKHVDEPRFFQSPTQSTPFRDGLMQVLRKPFNQEEYEKLLKNINARDYACGSRETRGRTVVYTVNRPGKSYLDRHPVLKRKIDAVSHDQPRVLNLLRGFFYWLNNLAYEEAFPPWTDASCRAVMPGSL